MIPRLAFFAGLVAGLTLATVSPAQYVADTGRREEAPTLSPSAMTTTVSAAAQEPAMPLRAEDNSNPALEQALNASGVGRVAVQSDGVNQTLRTFARVRLHAITGKKSLGGQDPLFTILSMAYQPERWMDVPLLMVEDKRLAALFGLNPDKRHRVSPVWVMRTPAVQQVVMAGLTGGEEADKSMGLDAPTRKALDRFRFHLVSFYNLRSDLKTVPLPDQPDRWVSAALIRNPSLAGDPKVESQLARVDRSAGAYAAAVALDDALAAAFTAGADAAAVAAAANRLTAALDGVPGAMAPHLRRLDYINTVYHPFAKAAWLFGAAFLAFLVFLWTVKRSPDGGMPTEAATAQPAAEEQPARADAPPVLALATAGIAASPMAAGPVVLRSSHGVGDPLAGISPNAVRGSRAAWGVAFSLYTVATVAMIVALGIRFVLGGRMPVSNLYESVVFAMGAFGVVGLVFEAIYRQGWIGCASAFTGWLLMTLANGLPLHMRKVDPLVAVLDSPWLNYHVTSLLVSYALFLAAFLFSVLYLFKDFTGNKPGVLPRKEVFEYLTYRSIQVGWPLLTIGILLGAVWANTAWGNAWSWDPKETWALITWLTYTVYLHFRMILGWAGRRSIIASMVGFAMVLLTYFGVSFLPGLSGGMHSYAEPISR